MIPEGWTRQLLHQVVQQDRKICYGIVQPGEFETGGIPLIRGKDYSFGWVPLEEFFRVSVEIDRPYRRSKVRPNDLLLTIVGAGTGNVAVVPDWLDGANITQTTARIAVDSDRNDPTYVKALLESRFGQNAVYRAIKGGAQPGLNIADIEIFEFPYPPLGEQRRIAEFLSTWDRAIETVEALIANARIQKKALMQSLLTGSKRLPGFSGDWQWVTFSDVFERVREKNAVGNTNVLTISAQHGLISQVEYFNKSVASEDVRGYTLLRRGDFAYNKSYSDGYPMGAFKPLERYESGIVSSLYICFRLASGDHDHAFFRHYFEAGLFNQEVSAIAQEGARNHGLLNVSVVDFFDTSLNAPSREEQAAIAHVINEAESTERALEAQLAALRHEKSALMQQLLTGKRRVKVTESEAA
jgi:restriction endonuclease S subunit